MYKILNLYIWLSSNSYRHYTTNNIKRLIEEQKVLGITYIITTLILTIIDIYTRLTGYLETGALEVVFDTDGKILEQLVIVEEICAKLIFSQYVVLDWNDYCKFEAVCTANQKNNIIETEEEDSKIKAKQLKDKK